VPNSAGKHTFFRCYLVIADHNSYHIGELAIGRQVAGLWPKGERTSETPTFRPAVRPGLVSTIIPVLNRPVLVVDAVASVVAHTYRPIEVIGGDDGSTDETPRVLDGLAARHPAEVRVLHQPRIGVGAAREAGRRQAAGEFIQYLDSDDVLDARKFELQVAGLR